MPAAKQRASSAGSGSRGRGSSNGSSKTRSQSSNGSSKTRSQSSNAKKPRASNGAAAAKKTATRAAAKATSNGGSHDGPSTITSVGMSAAAGALGVAGGVLLGRTALQRNRKVLGVKLPVKIDLSDVTQQIGAAGRQFGKLAGEVRAVRQKAEQVGRAIG